MPIVIMVRAEKRAISGPLKMVMKKVPSDMPSRQIDNSPGVSPSCCCTSGMRGNQLVSATAWTKNTPMISRGGVNHAAPGARSQTAGRAHSPVFRRLRRAITLSASTAAEKAMAV